MAKSKKTDRHPAPGSAPEAERMQKAQARDRRDGVVPGVRAKARGTRTEPRRGYKPETRVSQPFRKVKAAPRLEPAAQANLDADIQAAITKIEADIQAESAARVAAVKYAPFRSTVRERIAAACNLA